MKRARLVGFADDSAPELADLLAPHGIDAAAFAQWLGERLGDYRASITAQDSMPSTAEELQTLRTLDVTLRAARDAMGPMALPPKADACAFAVAHRLGIDWPALRKRLSADLNMAASVLQVAAGRIPEGKRGRPTQTARAVLLRAIVERLRAAPMKADPARAIAAEIVARCGIDAPLVKGPTNTRAFRKAARTGP